MKTKVQLIGVITMCEICGATVGHRAGCPEFRDAEPDVYGTCEICGDPIEEGQDYFDIDGNKYHEDCFTGAYLKQG